MLAVAVGVAVLAVVVALAAAARLPHPWRLLVPHGADWRELQDPAPIAPQLLLAPHTNIETIAIRCYDARVHKGGLRATIGVFEAPSGVSSQEWVAVRLLSDPVEVPSSSTQVIVLGGVGGLHGMARTGWIRTTDQTGQQVGLFANINWYIPEQKTNRVHFVAVFTDAMRGERAVAEVSALCRKVRFERDDGRTLRSHAIAGGACEAPKLVDDHSTYRRGP
jgi:hypothetical protein